MNLTNPELYLKVLDKAMVQIVTDQLTISVEKHQNKRGNFLTKLWCCVGGGITSYSLVFSTQLIM